MTLTFRELIGRGWAFPPQLDARGAIALTSDDNEIQQAIYIILSTAPGERVMRPEFGCRIFEYIFAPANDATAAMVAAEVRSALARWEPRIELQDVIVTPSPNSYGILLIEVQYIIKATRDERSLVFPFYLMQ
ncbi:MAG: GPW/gp25 family protein [Aggregatilineales bacterium]